MLGKHLQFLLQKPSDNLRGRRFARQLGATDTQYSATRRQNRRVEKRTESGAFPCTCGRLEGGKGRICGICGRRRLCRCGLVSPFAPKITQENSEMVVGNTVNVDENMRYTYFNNYRSFNVAREKLQGDEVAQAFLQQEGSCFLWHTVWNKLYRRSLLDRCLPYFRK